jgi:hypothetical protein
MVVAEQPWDKMLTEAVICSFITQQRGHSLMDRGLATMGRSVVGIAR